GTITGNYVWTAKYTSDGNNQDASDDGSSAQERVTIPVNSTTLVTTASPNGAITLGTASQTLKDSAGPAGGTSPTGSITFPLTYAGTTVVDTETVTVNGNGTYTTPTGYALLTNATVTGNYVWTAKYTSGDGNNKDASDDGSSAQERLTINEAKPTLVT